MQQFYAPFEVWEDYINGMYNFPNKENEADFITKSIMVLSNPDLFKLICLDVLKNWPISSKVNLTNKQCNRRAWLGQSACCYKYRSPEMCTRLAWGRLSSVERVKANNVADQIIKSFELNYEAKNIELRY